MHPSGVIGTLVASTITTTTHLTGWSIQTSTHTPSDDDLVSTARASFFAGLIDVNVNIIIFIVSVILIFALGLTLGWCFRGNWGRSRLNSEKMTSSGSDESGETQITVLDDMDTSGSNNRAGQHL